MPFCLQGGLFVWKLVSSGPGPVYWLAVSATRVPNSLILLYLGTLHGLKIIVPGRAHRSAQGEKFLGHKRWTAFPVSTLWCSC